MKKLLIILLMAICAWEAWDYTHPQPVDRYVVKVTAADGDTLWHLVGDVMDREETAAMSARSSTTPKKSATLRVTCRLAMLFLSLSKSLKNENR